MANRHSPFHPIIYVRGYAGTRGEIDDTTADPFCGFNVGSTVYRAVPDKTKPPRKFIFESPVLRLASDFGYQDVYEDGYDITDTNWSAGNALGPRSIVVYRYYDEASTLLGRGETPSIDTFATDLGKLILLVRDLVSTNRENRIAPDDFRCYLVAHSMGGLVCRAFLQNPENDKRNARRYVDKLFTYATPHNGIDFAGINVPAWLSKNDINNFNRGKMAKYLAVEDAYGKTKRVDWLPEGRFPAKKVFCMIGTNRLDYETAAGMSRTFVGHGSDGLVRIENATLRGLTSAGQPGEYCAKALTYRAHSGYFGIVNSEEAYQNLIRFLFGDVRIDVWMDIDEIRLPEEVGQADAKGKKITALYQIEALASVRGKLWFLTRRVAEEDSVACVTHEEWKKTRKGPLAQYISTVFLASYARINKRSRSLSYSLQLGVRVPDYEVDGVLWLNKHYEGGYLFRNALIIEIMPPSGASEWGVRYSWQKQGFEMDMTKVPADEIKGGVVKIPFDSQTTPGIKGHVRFAVSAWNKAD